MSKALTIKEAAQALRDGKVINSANAGRTIKCKKINDVFVIEASLPDESKPDTMTMDLSRMEMLYSKHVFGMGPYTIAKPEKQKTESEK